MARFDVYRQPGASGYLLDCQAEVLSQLSTRFVVPLIPPDAAPPASHRLNPSFRVDGEEMLMFTQFAASVPVRELGVPVASLGDEHGAIMNALDMLMTGY
ncbi:CcdB family protein [Allosphingosinicella indica]|uniref:Toxin CcdB n=1 Tax=Allosphingosinicella indica TaxID=941907 RepID=A0A1X7FYU6_9SPHN|nr:CcdB family protein [Allosphingosinicella indica]SMF61262.1 toxin CcdB [Allosphingosinicella indica]